LKNFEVKVVTELIEKIFLAEHKSAIEELGSELDSLISLVNQLKDCDSLESLCDLLREISQDAMTTARGIQEDFDIED
jgi:hypothetical protein